MVRQRYLLKNITKYDVSIGDLRYKIPAGQTRDLLSPTARLNPKNIEQSKTDGSIAKRLGHSLVEVKKAVSVTVPKKTEADSSAKRFPQRVKSSIKLGEGEVSEEVEQITIQEDDALLKEMAAEDALLESGGVPIISKNKE